MSPSHRPQLFHTKHACNTRIRIGPLSTFSHHLHLSSCNPLHPRSQIKSDPLSSSRHVSLAQTMACSVDGKSYARKTAGTYTPTRSCADENGPSRHLLLLFARFKPKPDLSSKCAQTCTYRTKMKPFTDLFRPNFCPALDNVTEIKQTVNKNHSQLKDHSSLQRI